MGSNNEENDNASFQLAMQLINSSILPFVLKSVIELDLLEIIGRAGPGAYVSSSELVAQLATRDPAAAAVTLDRILGLLTSYSVLACKLKEVPGGGVERLYALAPVCKFLIKNEDGVTLAPFLLMNYDKIFMESWYHIKDAVLEGGIPFNRAYGMSMFDYMGIDSSANRLFYDVMSHGSTITMKKILEIYKGFEAINGTLVDVGGGTGTTLNMIISKYPTIKGVNFDLPQVIKDAPSYPGVEHIGGDMFVSVPKGDVMFMKLICHNWSDEHCLKFLKNCYDSLPINGKIIVVDFIVPTVHDTSMFSKNMATTDVRMFAYHGGKERTLGEFESLARGAGFQGFNLICPAFITYVMEFCKNNV